MKKILRTKLQYNCYKREDFDCIESEYVTTYDRSYDMFVATSTKEECERVMESFEDAIRAEGIQDCFDSNLEPSFDEKKELWVGAVEVYVSNDCVSDEKEAIKETYREWKQLLKTTPVVAEAPAPVEKNNSEFLIREIKTLSSGTILSIARQEGIVNNRANWLEAETIEEEWIEFVERTKDSSENWKQSWKKFAKYKDDMFEAWLNDESEEDIIKKYMPNYKPQTEVEKLRIKIESIEDRISEIDSKIEAGEKLIDELHQIVPLTQEITIRVGITLDAIRPLKKEREELKSDLSFLNMELKSELRKESKKEFEEAVKSGRKVKKIGGAIYVHKSNMESLSLEEMNLVSTRLEQILATEHRLVNFEIIKIAGDSVSFIECEGWNTLREPIVGDAYNVKADGSIKVTKKRENNPQIYHHKWMFVADDYDGFDVEKEKEWSKKWQSVVPKGLSSSLGSQENWLNFLREYGLEN